MKTAFVIHGTGGNPESNWFPWIKQELEKRSFQVYVPAFPTLEHQSLKNWTTTFDAYRDYIDIDTIFIAHSVGPSFVLSLLESLCISIKGCYFVAGFLGDIGIPLFDELNTSFVNRDFDWKKITQNSQYFYMCHGSDDPYVPLENAQKMAQGLDVDIDIIPAGGHLNSESGYTEFPYLLSVIDTTYTSSAASGKL